MLPSNQVKISGFGSSTPDFVFIGENAKASDMIKKRPFSGQVGSFLFSTLRDLGLQEEECYFTTVVKVITKEVDEVFKVSAEETDKEVEALKGKFHVMFGTKSLTHYTDVGDGIMSNTGRVINTKFGKTLFCISPDIAVMNPELRELFKKSLELLAYMRLAIKTFGLVEIMQDERSEEFNEYRKDVKASYMSKILQERQEPGKPKFKY